MSSAVPINWRRRGDRVHESFKEVCSKTGVKNAGQRIAAGLGKVA